MTAQSAVDAVDAQNSAQLTTSTTDLPRCQVPATFCRSFGAADGWALTGGHRYYVTIRVTLAEGVTTVVSPAPGQAAARTTAVRSAGPAAAALMAAARPEPVAWSEANGRWFWMVPAEPLAGGAPRKPAQT